MRPRLARLNNSSNHNNNKQMFYIGLEQQAYYLIHSQAKVSEIIMENTLASLKFRLVTGYTSNF